MNLKQEYLCVDFDGTIAEHEFPEIGPTVPFAIQWLQEFQRMGAKIILFTMRSDDPNGDLGGRKVLSEAVEFVERQGIILFGVNENPTQKTWTASPKAYGHIYIDDAAAGCPLIYPAPTRERSNPRPYVDWMKLGPLVERTLYHGYRQFTP